MLQKAVLSALVVCCGLLAKWLRVRVWVRVWVRVRVRAGARECSRCTFFFLWFISVALSSLAQYTVSVSACDGLIMDIQ